MNGILELKIKEDRSGPAIEPTPQKEAINLEKTDLHDVSHLAQLNRHRLMTRGSQ